MAENDEKPKSGGGGNHDQSPVDPEPEKVRPGEKEGEYSLEYSAQGKVEGDQKEWAVGNRKPKAEDPSKKQGPVEKELGTGPVYKKQFLGDSAFDTRESDEDATYVSNLEHKVSVEVLSSSFNAEELKGKITAVKFTAEGSWAHGQIDLVQSLKDLIFGEEPKLQSSPESPPAPMAARVGDLTLHGSPLVPGPGSPDVLIGGMPAWRIGIDLHLCPFPGPPHGGGLTLAGAPTVLINGFNAARAGDYVLEPTGGPDVILVGCTNVLIGAAAPPPPKPPKPEEPKPEDLPWVKFESVASVDSIAGSVDASVNAEYDLEEGEGKIEGKLGAMVVGAKAELPLKLRLRIPFTTYYLGLGVKVEGALLSAGAEAGITGGMKKDLTGKKTYSLSAGAKAGVGPGGGGIKFALDVAPP